jgi:hypothetical protein
MSMKSPRWNGPEMVSNVDVKEAGKNGKPTKVIGETSAESSGTSRAMPSFTYVLFFSFLFYLFFFILSEVKNIRFLFFFLDSLCIFYHGRKMVWNIQ